MSKNTIKSKEKKAEHSAIETPAVRHTVVNVGWSNPNQPAPVNTGAR